MPQGFENLAFNSYLPFKLGPEKKQGSVRICGDLYSLLAFIVGKKGKTVMIQVFQQDHPG